MEEALKQKMQNMYQQTADPVVQRAILVVAQSNSQEFQPTVTKLGNRRLSLLLEYVDTSSTYRSQSKQR